MANDLNSKVSKEILKQKLSEDQSLRGQKDNMLKG